MESVTRSINGQTELSSDKKATKELNSAIEKIVSLGNTPNSDIDSLRKAVLTATDLCERIDGDIPIEKIALTDWEKKQFKLVAGKFFDAGNLPITLGSIVTVADEQYSSGYSGTNICLTLLETRGLIKNLTHLELNELIRAANPERDSAFFKHENPNERTGFIVLTEKGKLYYTQNYL